jgi:hypothetical protein
MQGSLDADMKKQTSKQGVEIPIPKRGDFALNWRGWQRCLRTQQGKYVVIYNRVQGEWRIAYDIFNDDKPATP